MCKKNTQTIAKPSHHNAQLPKIAIFKKKQLNREERKENKRGGNHS